MVMVMMVEFVVEYVVKGGVVEVKVGEWRVVLFVEYVVFDCVFEGGFEGFFFEFGGC